MGRFTDRVRAVRKAKRYAKATDSGMSFRERRQRAKYFKRKTKSDHKMEHGGFQSRTGAKLRQKSLARQKRFAEEEVDYERQYKKQKTSGPACSCAKPKPSSSGTCGPKTSSSGKYKHWRCARWYTTTKSYPQRKCKSFTTPEAGSTFRNPSDLPDYVVDPVKNISDIVLIA